MKNPNKPPCIRNLDRFKKTCCPGKSWDGKEGCTCWIEMTLPDPDNPLKKIIKKNCMDIFNFEFQYTQIQLLEGNQKATESFRNGMTTTVNGNDIPKINPDIAAMYMSSNDQVEAIVNEFRRFSEGITKGFTKMIDIAERNSKLKIEEEFSDKGNKG